MEIINFDELYHRIEKTPLKEIRGRFRFTLPTEDWEMWQDEWSLLGETEKIEKLKELKNFFAETQIWALLVTDNGQEIGKMCIQLEMFDDVPSDPDLQILSIKTQAKSILLMLHSKAGWPDYSETGEFVAQLPLIDY